MDVLPAINGSMLPLEIKSTATPTSKHLKSMDLLRRIMPEANSRATLICQVKEETPMAHNSVAHAWNQLEPYLRRQQIIV